MHKDILVAAVTAWALATPAMAQTPQAQPAPEAGQPAVETPAGEQPGVAREPGAPAQEPSAAATAEPSAAGTAEPGTAGARSIIEAEERSHIRADKLIGLRVMDADMTEEVGKVRDLVLDSDGRVVGLVLSTGGFLGFGAKPVAVTWEAVKDAIGDEGTNFIRLSMTKDEIANAPEFKTREQQEREAQREAARQQVR